jgi:hypothetical protein
VYHVQKYGVCVGEQHQPTGFAMGGMGHRSMRSTGTPPTREKTSEKEKTAPSMALLPTPGPPPFDISSHSPITVVKIGVQGDIAYPSKPRETPSDRRNAQSLFFCSLPRTDSPLPSYLGNHSSYSLSVYKDLSWIGSVSSIVSDGMG